MEIKVMTITPQMAAEWLNHNFCNRKLSLSVANKYARDMASGRWELNGEAISFDCDGNLKNGQHRLKAACIANVSFTSVVTFGNESGLFDLHAKRTGANVLQMNGFESDIANNTVIGMIKLHFQLVKGIKSISEQEIMEYAKTHENEIRRILNVLNYDKKKIVSTKNSPMLCALWHGYLCGEQLQTIDHFTRIVSSGLSRDDSEFAAIAFRNTFLANNYVSLRNGAERNNLYHICSRALFDFSRGVTREKKYTTKIRSPYLDMLKTKDISNAEDSAYA